MNSRAKSVLALAILLAVLASIGVLVAAVPDNSNNLVPLGEEIFLRTAGGIGCQYCHGPDARGKVGPNIRGKSTQAITQALGTVAQMAFINLMEEEIEAVAAYLKHLESQP